MYTLFLALRAALFYLVVSVLVLIFTTLLFVVLPLPFRYGRQQISRGWAHSITFVGKLICGMSYQIIGAENIPKTPVVYLSKHQSAWETMTFTGLLTPNCFVCKEALLKIPFFGWSMAICRAIPINRSAGVSAFKKVLSVGKSRLAEGLSIIIFPEGTRVAPKQHPKFHRTGVTLATSCNVPIIPIAHNSGACWRRNEFIKRPGLITIIIGKAIEQSGKTAEAINQEVHQWMQTQMEQLEK
ncbi:MAG: lysophospholipid acyltransferase family protein [Gammaproteobacteria bacterium]|nr:lysophospholipid acyltransferase family protein [Gammaproteobacteria bacterium]